MNTATTHTRENSSNHVQATSRKEMKMNGRTSHATHAIHASHAPPTTGATLENFGSVWTGWEFFADISRQHLAAAMNSTSALYRGRENLRKIQQETAHQASVRYGEAAQKLSGHCQLSDVLPIQSELLRGDLQSAGQYWQQMMAAALQTQKEMMTSMSGMLDADKVVGVKSALEVFQAAIPALASSFFVNESNRQNEYQHDS